MNLTNEEKGRIVNAANAMMVAFFEFRNARNRLDIANTIAGNLAQIRIPDNLLEGVLEPYEKVFKEMQEHFFDVVGIPKMDKEFWDWYKRQPPSIEQLKHKWKEVVA